MVTPEMKLTIISEKGGVWSDGEATKWIFGISLGKSAALFKEKSLTSHSAAVGSWVRAT